jgi:hypothetical protein
MKYFTPDLLSRFDSPEEAAADGAAAEWEDACARYNAYLDSVKAQMPPGLRLIEDSYSLHDAKVRGMGKRGRSFVLMLQLDTPPHPLLGLTFTLVGEPEINRNALPRELCSTSEVPEWQYDEIELVAGSPPTWSWRILFSNGWEVHLPLRDVEVQEVQALIPSPRNGSADGAATSMAHST